MAEMGLLDVMVDAARQNERNPIARRYVELFNARRNGYLTEKEMQRVCYCHLDEHKRIGELRTNRYVPAVTDSADVEQIRSWRRAGGQNHSDQEWLEKLAGFDKVHSLAMSKKEAQWYMYIHEGVIGDEVAAYLQAYGQQEESSI